MLDVRDSAARRGEGGGGGRPAYAKMEVWGIKIAGERMSRTLRIVAVEESCESGVGC